MMDLIEFAGHQFPPNKAYLICDHVFTGSEVFQVAHDEDGLIQFFCSEKDHHISETKTVCLEERLRWHTCLTMIKCLLPKHYATRQIGGDWIVRNYSDISTPS